MNFRLTALTLLLLAGACSTQPPVPQDHFYRLPPPSASADIAGLSSGAVFVGQFSADGIFQERAIAYVETPEAREIRQFHYHFWMESPSRLIRDQLIDFLRAGNAAEVVSSAPDIGADLSFHGTIRRFELVTEEGHRQVVVGLEFRVNQSNGNAPLLIGDYEERVPVAGEAMSAAVDAFGAALDRIFARVVGDVRARR